ncbi:3-ketodihydrosphingosine reductase [Cylas formicarius]|uniref:3-ketodihydrosphingosine reductase n=1 Tax=Cylas formicarius TaxID=197179 RepID=UPI0029588058|nr:3-ketodihydrosphingosine reductase [Cylas formicarius]
MYYSIILCLIVSFIFVLLLKKNPKRSIKGKHVVITGGSSGIGKAMAILAAQQGAHVSLLARNLEKLEEARTEVKKHIISEEQIISRVSVDVSHREAVENNILELETTVGPIYMLVNCAGFAVCGKLEDISDSNIKRLIDVNYLGTLYPTKAVLPRFKERHEGIIVLTSSQVGLMGMFGYSVYSSCKFALRGLAESLNMEVKPFNISITLALPPDTDTPGFDNENQTKPVETKLISEVAGLYQPETVAKKIMENALEGQFFSYLGFESFLLTTLCVGMSPYKSILGVLLQAVILGPFRLIAAFYLKYFDCIILKVSKNNQ